MEFSLKLSTLIIATFLTGLSAGLCFTWSNAVTIGIGRLDDLGYLQAFQQMNRAIINPTFMMVFFGPFIIHLTNIVLFRNASSTFLILLIASVFIYFFGVLIVTIFGNVPLNELLDKTDLERASLVELHNLRDRFEIKWNQLHLIRTITGGLSFLLLLVCLLIWK